MSVDRVPLYTSLKSRQVAERASTLSRIIRLWISPLGRGGFQCCHVSYSSEARLSAEVGSDAATYPTALDLTSRLRWDPSLPQVLRLWTSPPDWDGLRRCHVPYGSKPHLLAEVGSSVTMCPMALELASRLRWTLALPRILLLRILPLGWGGLRRCHVY
jgi:hypothetical protein